MGQYTNHLLITCGDWDFKTMLPLQLNLLFGKDQSRYPLSIRKWCNIKVRSLAQLESLKSLKTLRRCLPQGTTPVQGKPKMEDTIFLAKEKFICNLMCNYY